MIREHGYLRGDLECDHDIRCVHTKGSLMHVLINHVLTTSSLATSALDFSTYIVATG